MIPVDQTEFPPGVGDCLRACVASILELPIEAVPHFLREAGERWLDALSEWLAREFDLGVVLIRLLGSASCTRPAGYCIASGPAPHASKHSVVWKGGTLIHDPHPDRIGLTGLVDLLVFTAPDPAQLRRRMTAPSGRDAEGLPAE